jgi:hypothetical protein
VVRVDDERAELTSFNLKKETLSIMTT